MAATAASATATTGRVALALLIALTGLCLGWELWWAPTGSGTLAIKALPLVLALPGLWRGKLYTHRWLCLAVWLYVAEGLVRATSEGAPGAWLAAAEVALAVALFGVCSWHVRATLKLPKPRAAG